MPRFIAGLVLMLYALTPSLAAGPVNYDIVYVRAPRSGDNNYVRFPDVFFPTAMPSGSDLMLLHADGSEETLFAAGKGAVLDPAVSFDAQWVFFSYIPDASSAGINSPGRIKRVTLTSRNRKKSTVISYSYGRHALFD